MSTYLDRRLTCGGQARYLRSLPANWPERDGARLIVDPPVLLDPNKKYRVRLDLDAGTASVVDDGFVT